MLFAMLKNKIEQLRLHRWLIGYGIAAALVAFVLTIFFRNSSYSIDQLVIILATPVFIIIIAIRLLQHFATVSRADSSEKDISQTKTNSLFLLVASLTSVVFLGSLIFAFTMLVSAFIYLLLGLNLASNVALHTVSVLSFKVAGYSLALLLLMLFGYILYPYRHKVFRTIRARIVRFNRETKELRLNGRGLRLYP